MRFGLLALAAISLPGLAADNSTWRLQFYGKAPCYGNQGTQVLQISVSGLKTTNPVASVFSDADWYQSVVENGGAFGFVDNDARSQISVTGCGADPVNTTETATYNFRAQPGGSGIYYVTTNNHVSDTFCGDNTIPVTFSGAALLVRGSYADQTGSVECTVALAGPNVDLPNLNAPLPPNTPPGSCPDPSQTCPLTLIVPGTLKDAAEHRFYSAAVTAYGGTPPYTWAMSDNAPKGLTIGGGLISGTPRGNYPDDYIYPGGTFIFVVTVTDSAGKSASALTSMDVNPPLSISPGWRPIVLAPATENAEYYGSVEADGGGYFVSYTNRWTVIGLPPGITYTLTGSDCIFGGTPKAGLHGTYQIVITVDDGFSRPASANAVLTVITARTQPLRVLSSSLPRITQGGTVGTILAATGGSGVYSWELMSAGPPTLSLAANGVLSGTASQGMDAPYSFTVKVTDSDGKTATGTLTLQVLPPAGSSLHLSSNSTLPIGYAGYPFTAAVQPLGGFPPYTVALDPSSPPLPPGVKLNPQGTLSGTPQGAQSVMLMFRVTDSKGQTSGATLTLQVSGGRPPLITSLSPESVPVNSKDFTLTLDGNGFEPGATVLWNSQSLTTSGSGSRLQATVPASLLNYAGVASVSVSNHPNPPIDPAVFAILSDKPSTLTVPIPGTLVSDTAFFQWIRSIASQYRFQVGDNGAGTNNLFDQKLDGTSSSVTVNGLPVDGRTIYVRLSSLMEDGWHDQDSTFKMALAPAVSRTTATVTLNFTNSLLYAVNISVNGSSIGTVGANSTARQTVSIVPPLMVSVELVRPTLSGRALGDPFSGSYSPITTPAQVENFVINNQIGSQLYFVPIFTNATSQDRLLGVNMSLDAQNRCNCIIPAGGKNVAAGYYRLYRNSDVRLYAPGSGYTGSYIYWGSPDGTESNSFGQSVESKTGALRLTIQ